MYAAGGVVGAFESVRFQGTFIAGGKLEQTVNVVDNLPQDTIIIAKR